MDIESALIKLEKSRREKRITQEELCERIGITAATYRRVIKGEVPLINEHFTDAVKELGLDMDFLFQPRYAQQESIPVMADGRWSYSGELREIESRYSSEKNLLENELRKKESIIESLLETIRRQKEIISQKDETIEYQNRKLGEKA